MESCPGGWYTNEQQAYPTLANPERKWRDTGTRVV